MKFEIQSGSPGSKLRLLVMVALSMGLLIAAFSAAPARPASGFSGDAVDDTTPPVATVDPLPQFTMAHVFTVSWSGADDESGIAYSDVEYQANGGQWRSFRTATTETSGLVTDGRQGTTYGYRARAVDNAGNVQPWSDEAQATTTISIGNPGARITPFASPITEENPFPVEWTGYAALGASVVSFDVQYNINGGPWQDWLIETDKTSAQFTVTEGDGVYGFQVRARDNAGRESAYLFSGSEGIIAVDLVAPKIIVRGALPVLFGDSKK